MDAYMLLWYNTGTVEKVALYVSRPHNTVWKGKNLMAESEKRVSEAQRRATNKYLEKFDEMRVRVPMGQKGVVKAHAEAQGESLNAFINRAITQTMERDTAATEEAVK